jgi:hypothetical protein
VTFTAGELVAWRDRLGTLLPGTVRALAAMLIDELLFEILRKTDPAEFRDLKTNNEEKRHE